MIQRFLDFPIQKIHKIQFAESWDDLVDLLNKTTQFKGKTLFTQQMFLKSILDFIFFTQNKLKMFTSGNTVTKNSEKFEESLIVKFLRRDEIE